MNELTVAIIKPDAVADGHAAWILYLMATAGFNICDLRMEQMSRELAERFYEEHAGKPFFDGLISFMTSGPSVYVLLRADDVIGRWRRIMGATNPAEAAEGTIRSLYGTAGAANAVHGSDSPSAVSREIGLLKLHPRM